jgi:group II intron reverse transcriptase/maturase
MLSQKSAQNSEYVFDRLYRNLFNPDFYQLAASTIDAREGRTIAGVDERASNTLTFARADEIIARCKQEIYYPGPASRTFISDKYGAKQASDLPALQDMLVQKVVQLLLQAVYEPGFKDTSHGFRPGRSCHTALVQLKTTDKGTNWVIGGDTAGCFARLNHDKLLAILSRKISDGRFLHLIDRFLKAGYLEFQPVLNSLTGTPQGGSIGPILANIYLHELDVFMEDVCHKLAAQQVRYVRHAGDFIVLLTGNRGLAEHIRQEISAFLQQELHLAASPEKLPITNLCDQRVRFLGYEIARPALATRRPEAQARAASETIQLLVPGEIIQEKLKPFVSNGKATHYNARINVPLLDLLMQYNAEIRGLYNYYCLATDVSKKIGRYRYYHYHSLLKTVARKEQCSIAQILSKYGVDIKLKQKTGTRKIFGVVYQTKAGSRTLTYFNESIKRRELPHI